MTMKKDRREEKRSLRLENLKSVEEKNLKNKETHFCYNRKS